MAELTIVKVNVGEAPEVAVIPNTLASLKEIVGGWIETVRITDDLLLIVDEEGLLKQKERNFSTAVIDGGKVKELHTIVGNCFFVAVEGAEFVSLNDEQIQLVKQSFLADRKVCLVVGK